MGRLRLNSPNGLRIEVKCAAYLQTWEQKKPSVIQYDIAPRKEILVGSAITKLDPPDRTADVYIFCLYTEYDTEKY